MPEFYFTFGQIYRHDPHPQRGHPDGWFTIEADTEQQARFAMVHLCGPKWGTSYRERPNLDLFPMGELRRFRASDILNQQPPHS